MAPILEIASKISTPLALAGLFAAVVLFVFQQVLKSDKLPQLTKAVSGQVVLAVVNRLFVLALVAMILGFIGFALPDPESLYTVRVNVLDPQGNPVDEAIVQSTLGGERQQFPGGWEFRIPEEQVPEDRRATFRARLPSAFLGGQQTVLLTRNHHLSVDLTLSPDTSARVSGIVIDEAREAVEGALVFVSGYDQEAVTTSKTGGFTLAAHAAEGEQVLMRAQHEEYGNTTAWHPAGSTSITLQLRRK